ncbi:MAG: response regulator [Bacteroidetes bacterium]|nr:MAG: response regulator [Bacteroidota bacterium]
MRKILIVDDSLYMRTILKDALTGAGFEVVGQTGTGEQAIDLALELQPDYITLDNILPDMLGLDVLKVLREEKLPAKILMVSAVGQQSVIDEGSRLGANGYLIKPFTNEQLIDKLNLL